MLAYLKKTNSCVIRMCQGASLAKTNFGELGFHLKDTAHVSVQAAAPGMLIHRLSLEEIILQFFASQVCLRIECACAWIQWKKSQITNGDPAHYYLIFMLSLTAFSLYHFSLLSPFPSLSCSLTGIVLYHQLAALPSHHCQRSAKALHSLQKQSMRNQWLLCI